MGLIVLLLLSVITAYFTVGYFEKFTRAADLLQIENKVEDNVATDMRESQNDQQLNSISNEKNTADEIKDIPEEKATAIPDSEKIAITIEEAKVAVPVVRDKDPKKRLEEAKLYAKPQIQEGKYIDVSLAHQNMVLFEDGKFVNAYLISSGKKGLETPVGTFHIENKVPRAWSKRYGLFMPNWMALVPSGLFGIHELPEWPGGYKEGANHIGVAVSHGCVRLGADTAKIVYDWSDVGTTVIIHK